MGLRTDRCREVLWHLRGILVHMLDRTLGTDLGVISLEVRDGRSIAPGGLEVGEG